MIERCHSSDQEQLQNFSVVSRDHFHYLKSLKLEDHEISESRKCVREYSVLFDYYHRDLNSSLYFKERLTE
jgi:hypothetical protein